jgi:hypothetical protein
MSKLVLFLIVTGCGMICISPCFSQDTFVYKGVIEESHTHKGLPGVRIYVDNDTVAVKSDDAGAFRITVRKGSHVRYRKTGYTWQNREITGNDDGKVAMSPGSPNETHSQFDEVEVDGKLLPKEEWNDINSEYIRDVAVSKADDEKVRLIIKTK